jgi:hypothetical protein
MTPTRQELDLHAKIGKLSSREAAGRLNDPVAGFQIANIGIAGVVALACHETVKTSLSAWHLSQSARPALSR